MHSLFKLISFNPDSLEEPGAWVGHLPFAYWIVKVQRPKVLVELGTHSGNSYFSFCQAVKDEDIQTKCFAVDTWEGDPHAGEYDNSIFKQVEQHNLDRYSSFSKLLRMRFDDAVNLFEENSIDLLHIDGLHTYEAVKHDFDTWLPKLSPDAIVLFHDTQVRERNFGVWKLWEELTSQYPINIEFTHSHGLGVLRVIKDRGADIKPWAISTFDSIFLTNFFASLGSRYSEMLRHKSVNQQLFHLSHELNEKNAVLQDLTHELNEKNAVLQDLTHELNEKNAVLQDLAKKINSILSSNSWVLTKPLRYARRFFLKIKIQLFLKKLSRKIYQHIIHRVPLSPLHKKKIKNILFRVSPFLFSSSESYKHWKILNQDPKISEETLDIWKNISGLDGYVPIIDIPLQKNIAVKAICFYLPQFHPIKENDRWWGKGFTEWTNVRPAKTYFDSHYQPHIPGELGYYDLLDKTVMQRQIDLAKLYGIGGFCFYFYWFGGVRLLEDPLKLFLNDSTLDFPFCLCWANENWTRRWDGLDREVLISQAHSDWDDIDFISYISQYLKDARYIRIGGKPLVLIYRPNLLPSAIETVNRWRIWCRENGVGEIFVACTQSFSNESPGEFGCDAAVEFPPNNAGIESNPSKVRGLSNSYQGNIYDMREVVAINKAKSKKDLGYKIFRGVCPSWDNTPRRKNLSSIFINSSPSLYQNWLEFAVADTLKASNNQDENLIFINAWNEWAEGAHLEPDSKYGYAWLQATRNAITGESYIPSAKRKIVIVSHDAHPHGAQMLVLNLARVLNKTMGYEVDLVCLGGGILIAEYQKWATVHILPTENSSESSAKTLAKSLYEKGHRGAVVNTTVSGLFLKSLAESGINCVALIHELKGVIEQFELTSQAKSIADHATKVIFPSNLVATSFKAGVEIPDERIIIRPQGLYKRSSGAFNKISAKAELSKRYGIPLDAKIVLGVGYADFRKGIDLFIKVGLLSLKQNSKIYFFWVGHWDAVMRSKVDDILKDNSYLQDHFIFPGIQSETDIFYSGADVYALTSREDPFPSVVLEAMEIGLPIIGFKNAGGFEDLLARGCGKLVNYENVEEFSTCLLELLSSPKICEVIGAIGMEIIEESFNFNDYVYDLLDSLKLGPDRISVVVPNYNYGKYLESRLKSIFLQDYPIFEVIFLDDNSTDNSLDIAKKALLTSGISYKIIKNESNSGSVFKQWWRGVSSARGKYIWIAEADDSCAPTMLSKLHSGFLSPDVAMSYCDSLQIDEYDNVINSDYSEYLSPIDEGHWKSSFVNKGVDEIERYLSIKNTIPNVSGVLFRADALKSVMGEFLSDISGYRVAGDWLVYLKILEKGDVAFTASSLNTHRRHSSSQTASGFSSEQIQEIQSMQDYVSNKFEVSQVNKNHAKAYIKLLEDLNAD